MEMLFLSANPRKDEFLDLKPKEQIECFFGFDWLLRLMLIRLVRNTLWINATVVSFAIDILPLSVRTRTTTIFRTVFSRGRFERKSGFAKGYVCVNIGEEHRKIEENMDTAFEYHYQHRTEKYWQYWNDLEYEPRYFIMTDESRLPQGRVNTSETGQYTNSMGENTGFLLGTGDHVVMKEIPCATSKISLMSSQVVTVLLPLTCGEANNLVHWIWQHSIDAVYGALERRGDYIIDRNMFEIDVCLLCIGIAVRQFIIYFSVSLLTGRTQKRVTQCLLLYFICTRCDNGISRTGPSTGESACPVNFAILPFLAMATPGSLGCCEK